MPPPNRWKKPQIGMEEWMREGGGRSYGHSLDSKMSVARCNKSSAMHTLLKETWYVLTGHPILS